MNRRNFLKGFLAATGTLVVAPGVVLASVDDPMIRFIEELSMDEIITRFKPDITPLDVLCRAPKDFIKMRQIHINYSKGTEWKINQQK